jgi:hypothetical protein
MPAAGQQELVTLHGAQTGWCMFNRKLATSDDAHIARDGQD